MLQTKKSQDTFIVFLRHGIVVRQMLSVNVLVISELEDRI